MSTTTKQRGGGSYQPLMSRRSPHLEEIWPQTAECSSMTRQTLHSRYINRETSGVMQAFQLSDSEDMLAELTDSGDEHDAEANKYGKLVPYPERTKRTTQTLHL